MSRVASRSGAAPASAKRAADDGETCPICKSSRYLNPTMKILINPECYHRICGSCADRIFMSGPAPCPTSDCNKTLRRGGFRVPSFADLAVEREVDIRAKMAKIFNKTQADFESLRDFNDYLEKVEEWTFNLIMKVDLDDTERKVEAFEAADKAEAAALNPSSMTSTVRARDTGMNIAGVDPNSKRKGAGGKSGRTTAAGTPDPSIANGTVSTASFFKGIKKRVAPPPEKPYDPYGGWSITPQYYIVKKDYSVDWVTNKKNDPIHKAGGYDMMHFYNQSLCDAFGGLGVFVQDEIVARETQVSGDAAIGTENAAAAALDVKDAVMQDVF